MDGSVITLTGLAISTGMIIWNQGRRNGQVTERVEDQQKQIDRLAHESATKSQFEAMTSAFQDEVGQLVKTVDSRMRGVEEMVDRRTTQCEAQISELRQVMLRRPSGS